MHLLLLSILLAISLFSQTLPSSFFNFFEERVSLCAEAIEFIYDLDNNINYYQQEQIRLLKVHVIDATFIDLPLNSTSSAHPSTSQSAIMYASKAQAADAKVRAQKRSRLIAEMARDLGRNEDSVASSTGSNHGTVSPDSTLTESIHHDRPQQSQHSKQTDCFDDSDSMSFHPERDEAINSTGQFNTSYSNKLPELRDTAKKYGRWAPRPAQISYVIDTSAIGRAFPDFSGGVSSDDDLSREIGRGNTARTTNELSIKYIEKPDHPDSPIVTLDNVQVLTTPGKSIARSTPLQEALRNNMNKHNTSANNSFNIERKEAIYTQYNKHQTSKSVDTHTIEIEQKQAPFNHFNKRHSVSDTYTSEYKENLPPRANSGSPYTSNASRVINGKRRPLHARVVDEFDETRSSTQSHVPNPKVQSLRAETSFLSVLSNAQPREVSYASTRSNGTVLRNTQTGANLEPSKLDVQQQNESQHSFLQQGSDQYNNVQHQKTQHRSAHPPITPKQPSLSRSRSQKILVRTQTPKHTTPNPTLISFVAPPHPDSSDKGTVTFDMGVPLSVREGKIKPRNASSKSSGLYGPVDGFELPDDEEDIYLMCETQKIRIAHLEEERTKFAQRIKELELQNSQTKQEHSHFESEMKVWENHKCVDEELEQAYGKIRDDHAQLQRLHTELKKETFSLRMEKKDWENHQCVDEKLELEVAQLKLEKAQFRVQQKSWESHRCLDKSLEREVANLRSEKKSWDAHECRDENAEMELAYLRKQKKGWESHECVDQSLEREVARLKNQKKAWDSHQCSDDRLEEENNKLRNSLKEFETHQRATKELESENAQLQEEKHGWEAHRCSDSALGESGSERGSSAKYKQLRIEKTRLEEKFTTLKTRYEILEKTSSHVKTQNGRMEEESDAIRQENQLLKDQMEQMSDELHEQVREIEKLSHKRTNSRVSISRASIGESVRSRKTHKADEMTSAFILPDIASTDQQQEEEATGAVEVEDVRNDMEIGDEPTLRPSMPRKEALAKAMRMIRDEIANLKAKLSEAEKAYQRHEGSMGKRERLRMERAINKLIEEISNKSDELYYLHDVELAHKAEDDEDVEEDGTAMSLPWEGLEETN